MTKKKFSFKALSLMLALALVVTVFHGATPVSSAASGVEEWAPNTAYAVNDTVTYSGSTYTCIQAHTSLVGWEPSVVPALWQKGGGYTPTPTQAPTPIPVPTEAPTPIPAPTNGATFYEHINYGGTAVTLGVGNYSLSQMRAKGIPNDWMSSLRVPSGWTVEVYEHDNFGGTKWTYTSSTSWVGTAANDKMSSVKIISENNNNNNTLIPLNNGMQMTIQFNNNTNGTFKDNQIYVNIIAKNNDGRFCTISPDGTMTPCVSGQDASPYFYPISSFNGFQIPKYVSSGRLYISMDGPLNIPFNTAADGTVGIAYPNIGNPSDPSYNKYFDWVEFAVVKGEVWMNTTQVDLFSIPYTIEMYTGTSTDYSYFTKVGIVESRESIFRAFQNEVPSEFKSLATVQAPYRIVAPVHGGFRMGQPNGRYFDDYINKIWSQYTNSDFILTVPQGTFKGRVSGTQMNFTRPGDSTIYRVNKPTTEEVFGGAGALASGNEIEKVLQAQICAAFHRHVMDNAANLNNPAAYYQAGPADYYAKFFHDHSIDGKAYGFCYDDVNDQSSTIHAISPRGAIINIGW